MIPQAMQLNNSFVSRTAAKITLCLVFEMHFEIDLLSLLNSKGKEEDWTQRNEVAWLEVLDRSSVQRQRKS